MTYELVFYDHILLLYEIFCMDCAVCSVLPRSPSAENDAVCCVLPRSSSAMDCAVCCVFPDRRCNDKGPQARRRRHERCSSAAQRMPRRDVQLWPRAWKCPSEITRMQEYVSWKDKVLEESAARHAAARGDGAAPTDTLLRDQAPEAVAAAGHEAAAPKSGEEAEEGNDENDAPIGVGNKAASGGSAAAKRYRAKRGGAAAASGGAVTTTENGDVGTGGVASSSSRSARPAPVRGGKRSREEAQEAAQDVRKTRAKTSGKAPAKASGKVASDKGAAKAATRVLGKAAGKVASKKPTQARRWM